MTAPPDDAAAGPAHAIAALRRQLAEREAERDAAVAREKALAEVLDVISRSPGDLAPVFEAVVQTAVRLCRADQAALYRLDHGTYRWAASCSNSPEYDRIERTLAIELGTGTLIGRVALEGRPVHILDAWSDPLYEARDEARVGGVHTMLGVPLLRDGVPIGAIGLARQRVERFSEAQIQLVSTFAAQAVIAMENARLLAEQRDALERQTATAEVLQVINASPGNVAPVFDAMLEKAMRLCDAAFGTLTTRDGEALRMVATRGVPPAYARHLRSRHAWAPVPGGVIENMLGSKRTVQTLDMQHAEMYLAGHENPRALVEFGGARTTLHVPLVNDGEVIGFFILYRQEVRGFTDKQIALLENFAAQAVIAMENARMITEQREALERQTATAEILQVINASTGSLQPVFNAVLKNGLRLTESASGALSVFDSGRYKVVAINDGGASGERPGHDWRVLPPGSAMARVAAGEHVVQIEDLKDTREYRDCVPYRVDLVERFGVRTCLWVGLRHEERVLGTIQIFRQNVRAFTDAQIALLESFAGQAVIAMENARLLEELQARTAELTRSVAELQALEEVLRAVISSLDLETVLATVIARAVPLAQADEGMIYEFDTAEQVFVPKAAFGMTEDRVAWLRERRIRIGETYLGRSAAERAPVSVDDVQDDPNAAEVLHGIRAVLAIPLLREDRVVGGLAIRRRTEGTFSPATIALMQTFAAQCVIAIENARLFEESRRARAAAETALADLRRAQDRLVQAEKMASLGQLTAGIAHEIKNPLNFVNNFAILSVELLDELKQTAAAALDTLDGDQRGEVEELVGMLTSNLEKITEHGKRADGIVRSMLEHSRGTSGERRAVDLNTVVEEALNLAYHGARAQDPSFNITLRRDYAAVLAPIEVNPQDITRVFLNLFSNGFYAARRRAKNTGAGFEPTLAVSTRDLGGAVEVRVRDNGTGIPTDIRDKLFQPFFTTKPTGEGTGLGLSITYDIVTQQHGGSITVDSEVDAYTEFVLTLPRATAANGGGRA